MRSIVLAALSYRHIIASAQADSLDVATQLRGKLARTNEGLEISTLLRVVGAVAGAVAAAGSGWGAIAWTASTSILVLDAIKGRETLEPQNLVINGSIAMDFVPSAHNVLDRLWGAINHEESMLRDGVQDNNDELDGNVRGTLEPREPDLANSDRRSDLGNKSNVTEHDIEELLRCAKGWLPAMAEMFHQAYLQVLLARGALHRMLGDNRVAGSQRAALDEAIAFLITALLKTRDYLYRCGENLSTIASNYYENEELNTAILRKIEAWLADPEEFAHDRYQPPSGPGRGGSNDMVPV